MENKSQETERVIHKQQVKFLTHAYMHTHKDSFFHLPAESILLTLKLMKLLLSLLLTTKAAALFPQKLCKKHAE